jgi:aldose 1-epimerase
MDHRTMTLQFSVPRFLVSFAAAIALPGLMFFVPDHLGAADARAPTVAKTLYGRLPDGTGVDLYTLTNAHGLEVKVMTYGATLTSVKTPDRDGRLANITLYLDTFEDYLRGHPLFGSVVGRYANRIAGAGFTIDGVAYPLTPNAGKVHIHGGGNGFQKKVWQAAAVPQADAAAVEFALTSPDGDEGYPGTLCVKLVYSLNNDNELKLEYTATTDKATVVNLTNHAYWNLAGAGSGDVLGHLLTLHADAYLPADQQKVPTGEIRSVQDTVMDFTESHPIGARIKDVEGENYDHCYVVNRRPGESLVPAAYAVDPKSGRVMEVWTTKPGVQFFTARFLTDKLAGGGRPYGPYHGFCLETQHFPDSPNRSHFPSPIVRPHETYHHVTVHKFGVQE